MNTDTKSAIEALVSIYEQIAPDDIRYYKIGPFELDSMRLSFACFLCYLAQADLNITWDECETIEYYTDLSFDPDQVEELVSIFGIDTPKYQESLPKVFVTLLKKDKELLNSGMFMDVYASELYMSVLVNLAQELLLDNYEISNDSLRGCIEYIDMYKDFLERNLRKRS